MFQLITKTQVADSATIPVTWCVDSALLEELEKGKIKNPHLLFVIQNTKSGNEFRMLSRFDLGAEYIQFHAPGENRIHTMLVWDSEAASRANLEDRFLRTDSGKYKTQVLNAKGCLFNDLNDTRVFTSLEDLAELRIAVSEGFFAKVKKNWHYRWVNFWYESAPRDECQFRGRILYSYTLKLLFAFVVGFFGISAGLACALWNAGFGSLNVNWKAAIHPFKYRLHNVYDEVFNGDWFGNSVWTWIFKPNIFIILFFFVWGIGNADLEKDVPRFMSASEALSISLAILFAGYVSFIAIYYFFEFLQWAINRIRGINEKSLRAKMKIIPNYDQELEYLLCENTPKDGTIRKKNFHLRLWRVKSQVCRPIAK